VPEIVALGVPLPDSVSPGGSAPDAMSHAYVPVPPVADTDCEYATVAALDGKLVVVMVSGGGGGGPRFTGTGIEELLVVPLPSWPPKRGCPTFCVSGQSVSEVDLEGK
jgi:hypothetical protein